MSTLKKERVEEIVRINYFLFGICDSCRVYIRVVGKRCIARGKWTQKKIVELSEE